VRRRWVTFYVNGGQLTVEREVAPPGTPAGPDPDRAEMLLAEGLANAATRSHADYERHGFIHWVAAWVKGAPLVEAGFQWVRAEDSDELAAMAGAHSHVRAADGWPYDKDHGNPDAYAAGAALAIALDGEVTTPPKEQW
jgi:hypothetical protein